MKRVGITIAIVLCLWGAGRAQPKALPTTFNQITSVTPVGGHTLLVTQYKGDYKAKLYDLSRDSVLTRFVHEGKGPGESPALMAAGYDSAGGRFTFFSRDHRWIQTDTRGKLLQETTTPIFDVSHICSAPKTTMQVFVGIPVPARIIQTNKPFPASYRLRLNDLSVVDSLMVTPHQLALDEIEHVGRTNSVMLDLIGHRLDGHRLLLTYEGSKYLFLFEDGQLKKRVPVEIPGNFGIRISERNGRVGTQAAGVFTHLQRLPNGTLLFSSGNTHQELPFGAIYVMISNHGKVITSYEKLYTGFGDVRGGYNHILAGHNRIWFSEFYFTGYSLYREPLPAGN